MTDIPPCTVTPVTDVTLERTTGAELLKAVYTFLARFVAYPSEAAHVAHTLWIAHTHAMEAWESTPRIAFLSPEPGSGKSRCLEISELLVPRAVQAMNVTPAYLFRKVADPDGTPTILYDEIDTVFGPRARDNEELRGLLNAGHRRGAVAGRCIVRGRTIETEEISAFCAVAMAGLGSLPDTILSRSVIINMKKRAPTEKVEPFRYRDHSKEGHCIRDKLVAWMESIQGDLEFYRPAMPKNVIDRDADVWEPLLAISEMAGGNWPKMARDAAVNLIGSALKKTPSLGIRLLSDIRDVVGNQERITTESLLSGLLDLPESAWADLKGKPLDARKLASMLSKYDIGPKLVRVNGAVPARGYDRRDFMDMWQRHLPPPDNPDSVTTVTGVTDSTQQSDEKMEQLEREAMQTEHCYEI